MAPKIITVGRRLLLIFCYVVVRCNRVLQPPVKKYRQQDPLIYFGSFCRPRSWRPWTGSLHQQQHHPKNSSDPRGLFLLPPNWLESWQPSKLGKVFDSLTCYLFMLSYTSVCRQKNERADSTMSSVTIRQCQFGYSAATRWDSLDSL